MSALNPQQFMDVSDFDHIPYEDDPRRLVSLRDSVAQYGFKEPIEVAQYVEGATLFVEDGRHRLEVARQLGIKRIPVNRF